MSKIRKKIIAGNWKMNNSIAESESLASAIKIELDKCREVDIVLCPPFTSLQVVSKVISNTNIKLGAQNMHWETDGAYTGEISAGMLRDLYCHYVILGHSERRKYFNETNAIVNSKVKVAITSCLIPIVCVGETLKEREAGRAEIIVREQVENSLIGLSSDDLVKVIVAYEPVWAIGTGVTATPEQAQDMHMFIRSVFADIYGSDLAESVRIQYGGSMNPANAAGLLSQPDIDGGLVGGASLDSISFVKIIQTIL